MSTALIVLAMYLIMALCGAGAVLLLLPRGTTALRVLSMPPVGLCSGVVVSMFLARFDLTGRTTALLALLLLSLLGGLGLWKSPPSRDELTRAVGPLLISVFGLVLVAWPLLYATHHGYIGYGNPDVPLLLQQAMYMDGHPFGLFSTGFPGQQDLYRGVRPELMLGMLYFFLMASPLSGAPIHTLFGVTCAVMVVITPGAVYTLAEAGFRLRRSTCLVAALATAGSSMLAYTFYLHSLGALSVMAIAPVALVLVLLCLEHPSPRRILLLAVVCSGMFYNYHAGLGLIGVFIGAVTLHALAIRRLSIQAAFLITAACLAFTMVTLLPYAFSILKNLRAEMMGSTLLARQNEIQDFFALGLTEHFVPYFWGLKLLTQPPPGFLGDPAVGLLILVIMGFCCFGLVLLASWKGVSGLPGSYGWIVGAFFLLVGLYSVRRVGYGVFKLAAWGNPVILLGLVAGALGSSRWLERRTRRLAALAPLVVLPLVLGWNVVHTIHLGMHSMGWTGGGGPQIVTGATFRDYAELREASAVLGASTILVALSDPVLNRWVAPFLPPERVRFLPSAPLAVIDSSPAEPSELSAYLSTPGGATNDVVVLHPGSDEGGSTSQPGVIWSNRVFAFSRLGTLSGTIAFGAGWYRAEESERDPVPFVRRFRWLRKRAEIFVLDGRPGERRLRLHMAAGPGNVVSDRHVRLHLNGRQFDEIHFSGYAQVHSAPVVLTGALHQIEIEVVEAAGPLPRRSGLWNRSVARDPRRLNVAVARVGFVSGDGHKARASRIDFTEPAQFTEGVFEGIHPDRWMGSVATVRLLVPPGAQAIEVRGMAPGGAGLSFPLVVEVRANGMVLDDARIDRAGDFVASVPIPTSVRSRFRAGDEAVLTLRAADTFTTGADPRQLSIRIGSIVVAGLPLPRTAPDASLAGAKDLST